MFLIVLVLITNLLNSMHEPTSSRVMVQDDSMADHALSLSEDELCDVALQAFAKKTDSDIGRYIKPYLASRIKEVASSPESDSDSDSPSPKRVIRTWVKQPESVRSTPRPELDQVVLAAVQKAFEEREKELEKKSAKIESMFSKKSTALITTVVGAIVTIATSLGSVYGTKNSFGNCTK